MRVYVYAYDMYIYVCAWIYIYRITCKMVCIYVCARTNSHHYVCAMDIHE
jgi:hypothetical protein